MTNFGRMGRVIIIVLLLVLAYMTSTAQNVLITATGDTVNCKIHSIDDGYITFSLEGNPRDRRKIAINQVSSYTDDYNRRIILAQDPAQTDPYAYRPPFKRRNASKGFMLDAGAAYFHRFAPVPTNVPEEIQEYIRKLKSGFVLKFDGSYFFGRFFGLGLKYSWARAQNEMDDVYFRLNNGSLVRGRISDKINIHTIALHATSRIGPRSGKFYFLPGISLGYTEYFNNSVALDPLTIRSSTFSFAVNLGMDIRLVDRLYLAVGLDVITGAMSYVEVEQYNETQRIDLDGENRESLGRIDIWGGFRYYFKPVRSLKKFVYE
jgi:hypothetical protein